MKTYVVKREKVRYTNGHEAPECFFKGTPLGLFIELTDNAEEAATYRRKADATKVAKGLGSRFFVAELA